NPAAWLGRPATRPPAVRERGTSHAGGGPGRPTTGRAGHPSQGVRGSGCHIFVWHPEGGQGLRVPLPRVGDLRVRDPDAQAPPSPGWAPEGVICQGARRSLVSVTT